MDYRQSVTLLRRNKRAQVDALREMGIQGLEYDTARAADFPKLMRWAKGILDVTLAVDLRKGDGTYERQYLTVEAWNAPDFPRDNYEARGVRIRAFGQSFVLAGRTYEKRVWGPSQATTTLHKFGYVANNDNNNPRYAHDQLFTFNDSAGETAKIVAEFGEDYNSGNYAARLCQTYKAYEGDTTEWSLPTYAQMMAVWRCRRQVTAAFQALFNRNFYTFRTEQSPVNTWWTACKLGDTAASAVIGIELRFGGVSNYGSGQGPTTQNNVTPISIE